MDDAIQALLEHLALEQLDDDLFRGQSRDIGTNSVFGGQVLGQALSAVQQTVEEDRAVHSLHAYFLREGDPDAPILYEVSRSRDGRSFSARQVVAVQHSRPIFSLSASFMTSESGLEHQLEHPDINGPETFPDLTELVRQSPPASLTAAGPSAGGVPDKLSRLVAGATPFEFRPVGTSLFAAHQSQSPEHAAWFRLRETLPDHPPVHRAILAYASDYGLLFTTLLPHGINFGDCRLQMVSLDHAMWFHRPLRVDSWLLYVMRSPAASGARGFAQGAFYDEQGNLVASTAQEGLIRVHASC